MTEPAAGTGRRWETPLVVAIGLAQVAVTAWAWWLTARTSQDGVCGSRGLLSLGLAASPERARAVLACPGFDAAEAGRSVGLDAFFVATYLVTIVFWCLYGALRLRRLPTRGTGWLLLPAVVVGAAADVVENAALRRLIEDGPGTIDPDALTIAFGAGIARWLTIVPAALYAGAAMFSALSRLVRQLRGSTGGPDFLAGLPSTPDPGGPPPRLDGATEAWPTPASVAHRFRRPGPAPATTTPANIGICLSGGGIRAASFALGAIQGLQEAGIYQRADFLATVSGGGYLGGALQIVAQRQSVEPIPEDTELLPFAAHWSESAGPGTADWRWDDDDRAPEVDYLTEHSRFLWPSAGPGQRWASTRAFVTGVGAAVLGIGFNVALVLAVLFVLGRLVGWAIHLAYNDPGTGPLDPSWRAGFLLATPLVVLGLTPHLVPHTTKWLPEIRSPARRRLVGVVVAAVVLAIAVQCVWWRLPQWGWAIGAAAIGLVVASVVDRRRFAGVGLAVLLAVVFLTWMEDATRRGPDGTISTLFLGVVVVLLVALACGLAVAAVVRLLLPTAERLEASDRARAPYVMTGAAVTLAVVAAVIAIGLGRLPDSTLGRELGVTAAIAAVLATVYLLVDQKRWSPHPIYKRRLARAFAPARGLDHGRVTASELPYGRPTTLSSWGLRVPGHPQLLVGGAAYDTERCPGRVKAWPFLFSAEYCGGPDVGWCRTVDFEAVLGRANGPDGTLLAAMAISGAAVSPGLGQINLGSANALLATANARLGVWLPSPSYVNELRGLPGWGSAEQALEGGPPVRWVQLRRFTYLFKEILGVHDPDDRFIFVTDGGQLDNLGLLELLSRRCSLVYCFDASGDGAGPGRWRTTRTFDAVRKLAWERFRITFEHGDGSVTDPAYDDAGERVPIPAAAPLSYSSPAPDWADGGLDPELVESLGDPRLADRLCAHSVQVFTIRYPAVDGAAAASGTLIYAKSVLSLDAPRVAAVYATRERAKRFPSDTTADQFPEPDQQRAYIALGYAAARAAAATPH
ncbi:MAG: hypothetical protein ACRD0A_09735 [Acidimicrobiales bacterium]